jgi:DNA-binding transcriptional MerR regulator
MICRFSIKDLEKLSGVKAHTLRVWEQRYGILNPQRTDTNIRWYCNDELKNILNVCVLNNHGYKISKIATLSKEERAAEVNKITSCEINDCEQISSLVIAMVEMDETRFEKIISTQVLRKGFTHTMEEIVYPFLKRIAIMWQTGSINSAQDHFITNLIRQKLVSAIDGLHSPQNPEAKRFILFLPDAEFQELRLLYYHYILKSRGHSVIYLGQSVQLIDLQRVYEIREPHYLLTVFTRTTSCPEAYAKTLSANFPNARLLFSGCQLETKDFKAPANMAMFRDPKGLLDLIA